MIGALYSLFLHVFPSHSFIPMLRLLWHMGPPTLRQRLHRPPAHPREAIASYPSRRSTNSPPQMLRRPWTTRKIPGRKTELWTAPPPRFWAALTSRPLPPSVATSARVLATGSLPSRFPNPVGVFAWTLPLWRPLSSRPLSSMSQLRLCSSSASSAPALQKRRFSFYPL